MRQVSIFLLFECSLKGKHKDGPICPPMAAYSYIAERSNGQTILKCIYFICLSEQNK